MVLQCILLYFLCKVVLVPHNLVKYLNELLRGIIQEPSFFVLDQLSVAGIIPNYTQLTCFKPLLYGAGLTLADTGVNQDDRVL